MSTLQLPRAGDNTITKKVVNSDILTSELMGLSPASTSATSELTSAQSANASLASMTIGGQTVTPSATSLGYLSGVTAGTASADKVLITDANKDISNVNSFGCTTMTVGTTDIVTSLANVEAAPAIDYFTNITAGTATSESLIAVNASKDISMGELGATTTESSTVLIDGTPPVISLSTCGDLSYGDWRDCCWSPDLNKLLAVGYNKAASLTFTGDVTNVIEFECALNLEKVVWCPWLGLFVAIADSGAYKSMSGSTFTPIAALSGKTPTAIFATEDTLLIAATNEILWSTDAITFESATVTGTWKAIHAGNLAHDGWAVMVGTNAMAYIVGTWLPTWYTTTVTGSWTSVTRSKHGFVAVCSDSVNTGKVAISNDGMTWTKSSETWRTNGISNGCQFNKVMWIPTLDMYVTSVVNGGIGEPIMYMSHDAVNWQPYTSNVANTLASYCWCPTKLSIVGISGGMLHENESYKGLMKFAAANVPAVYPSSLTAQMTIFGACCEANTMIYGTGGSTFVYSADGMAFNVCTESGSVNAVSARTVHWVAYSPTLALYVAVGSYHAGGPSNVMTSTNGTDWTSVVSGKTDTLVTVLWHVDLAMFIATSGSSNYLITSTDGVNWTNVTFNLGVNPRFMYIPEMNAAVMTASGSSISGRVITKVGGVLNVRNVTFPTSLFYVQYANGVAYCCSATNAYTTTDFTNFTNLGLAMTNTRDVVVIKELGLLIYIQYSSPNTSISVFNGSTWTNNVAIASSSYTVVTGFTTWSNTYKRFYFPNSPKGITMTRSLSTKFIKSDNFADTQDIRCLPMGSLMTKRNDDAIRIAMNNKTITSTTFDAVAATGVFFDKNTNSIIVFGNTITGSYSTNGGISFTANSLNPLRTCAAIVDLGSGMLASNYIVSGVSTYVGITMTNTTGQVITTAYDDTGLTRGLSIGYMSTRKRLATITAAGTTLMTMRLHDRATGQYDSYTLSAVCESVTAMNNMWICVGLNYMFNINADTLVVASTACTGAFKCVAYSADLGISVAVGTNIIAYTTDGVNWTRITGSISWARIIYVPEIRMFAACGTSAFGYSADGINWQTPTIAVSNTWIDLTYNTYNNNFVLLGSSSPKYFTSGPVLLPVNSVASPSNAYVEDDKLSLLGYNVHYKNAPLTHALETDFYVYLKNTSLGTSTQLGNQSTDGYLSINSLSKFALPNADGSTKGLSINGSLITANGADLTLAGYGDVTHVNKTANGYLRINSSGRMEVTTANVSSLQLQPANASSGLIVSDANASITVPKCNVKNLTIGNTTMTATSTNSHSTLTDFVNLSTFPSTGYSTTSPCIMAYSSELNMTIVLTTATSTTTYIINYSYDYGATWSQLVMNVLPTITQRVISSSNIQTKLLWIPQYKMFGLAGDSAFYYSYDGLFWYTGSSYTAIGTGGNHIYLDAAGKPNVCGTLGWCVLPSAANPSGAWTVTTSGTQKCAIVLYSSYYNKYYGIVTGGTYYVYYTTDQVTWTQIASAAYVICGLGVSSSAFYFIMGGDLYKSLTSTTVTTIIAGGLTTARGSLCYIPETDQVLHYTSRGKCNLINSDGSYSSSLTPYSCFDQNATLNQSALTTYMIWTGKSLLLDTYDKSSNLYVNSGFASTIPCVKRSVHWLKEAQRNRVRSDGLTPFTTTYGIYPRRHATITYDIKAIAQSASMFLYVGTNVTATTTSLKLDPTFSTTTGNWIDCLWDGTRWVMLSDSAIAYSTDASAWTQYSFSGGKNIVYYGGQYVVSTATGVSATADITANTWTTLAVTGTWNAVKHVGSYWVLLGNNAIAYNTSSTSTDNTWIVKECIGTWFDIAYGRGLYVACGASSTYKTYDFTKGVIRQVFRSYNCILYSRLFGRFYMSSNDRHTQIATNIIVSSFDGYNWVQNYRLSYNDGGAVGYHYFAINRLYWVEDTTQWVMPATGDKVFVMYSEYIEANDTTALITTPTTFECVLGKVNIANTSLAGGNVAYFNVCVDSAAKPATSTWTTSSDERLKEDIQDADLELCYNVVKQLPLKYYKWKDDFAEDTKTEDMHRLGWIAQDVEKVIPKAVSQSDYRGIPDCRNLNTDQIIAHLYGAIKYLQQSVAKKEDTVKALIDARK